MPDTNIGGESGGLTRDSTPRSVSQSRAAYSEARYRATFENAAVGIANVGLDGRWIMVNQTLCQFLGYSKSELLELNFQQLTHPDELDRDVESARRLIAGQLSTYSMNKRYRRRDGVFVWACLTVSLVRDAEGRPVEFVSVVEDIGARRQAEDELRAARKRLESALTASEVGTYEWDIDADRVYVDTNFAAIQPVELDSDGSAPSARIVALFHPEDRPRVTRLIERSVKTGLPYEVDCRLIRDGDEKWITVRGNAERTPTGRVIRFYGTVIDITQRKQAELEREQLAEQFRQLSAIHETVLKTTSDFAYLFDREGRFQYANERLLTVWARSLPEIVGKTFLELGYPEWHAEMHMREIAQVIATRQPITGEAPFTGDSGIYGIYEYVFSPVIGTNGQVAYVAGTARDVTARKKSEEDLKESERRLTLAQQAGGVGVYDWNVLTNEVVWTRELETIYGMPMPENSRDRFLAWQNRVHPDDKDRMIATAEEWLGSTRTEEHWEYRFVRPDGDVRWIAGHSIAIRDDQNRALRVIGTNIDITDRKHIEQALRDAKDAAESANRAKDHFLAVLSHELRTPLTPVLAITQLLQGDESLSVEQQELIQTIQRNVLLEARLIDDLLDLTSIARNKLALHITTADVHELINQVVKMCAGDFAAKELAVETRLDACRHTMQADPTRLQQVIWNLVKNAIKFTTTGGRISISSTDAAPSHVAVEVADDGIGIAPDVLPHVFDEFEQGGKEVTHLFGGLGLGLAISKALVEMQGGEIVAASEGHGRGSKFTVRLPTGAGNRPAAPQKSAKATPRLQCSILLVEDHADTRRSMTALLGRIGCDVKAAGTVGEALELATNRPFDVLISDIGLPDGSGVELMRELRAKFGLRGIALSGYGMEDDLAKSSDAGFEAHLTKPVHFQILVETVRRLVTAPR